MLLLALFCCDLVCAFSSTTTLGFLVAAECSSLSLVRTFSARHSEESFCLGSTRQKSKSETLYPSITPEVNSSTLHY